MYYAIDQKLSAGFNAVRTEHIYTEGETSQSQLSALHFAGED